MNKKETQKEVLERDTGQKDRFLAFIAKKAERIAAAVYVVTNLLSDEEPLKWRMRRTAVTLLGELLPAKAEISPGERVSRAIRELVSFIGLASLGGLLSEMNSSILKGESEQLLSVIEEREREIRQTLFPEEFFAVGELPETIQTNALSDKVSDRNEELSDTQSPVTDIEKKPNGQMSDRAARNRQLSFQTHATVERRKILLETLKKNPSGLSARELSKEIGSFSEKTAQRDLSLLERKGLVKRDGSKRWTKYLLKQ